MSTYWIILIISIVIILGIISLFISLKEINNNVALMCEYQKYLRCLYKKIALKKDCSEDMGSIVAKSSEMSKIMKENIYHKPILELSSDIQYGRPLPFLIKKIEIIDADFIKRESYYRDKHAKIKLQIFNPFSLFYRGIGLAIHIVFGYLISMINPDFNFEGKVWTYANIAIAFLGGIASIWQLIVSLL